MISIHHGLAFFLATGGTLLNISPSLFVSGHGHLISPRSRNFFAYEAGRDDPSNSPPGLPPREYCSHCLNAKLATETCGRGSAQSYDPNPTDGWLDTKGNPMPWISQATYVEGQEVLMSIELTTNHAGHAEMRACPMDENTTVATQECFDAHPLTFVRDVCWGGPVDEIYPIRGYFSNNVMHHFIYRLPEGLVGNKVLLQWRYIAANGCIPPGYKDEERLGLDALGWLRGFTMADCNVDDQNPPQQVLDPTGGRGDGDPEQFWNCAEVSVLPLSTANPDPGPHPANEDICGLGVAPPEPTPTTPTPPSPISSTPPVDPNAEGYCNWGPLGTGLSSTCDGCVQGGSVCNAGAHQCESDCGGRWCTNIEAISSTCSSDEQPPSPSPPTPPTPPLSNNFYCGTSWMDAKDSTCKPLSDGGGLSGGGTSCADGNSTVCEAGAYCYADIICDVLSPPTTSQPTNSPMTSSPINPGALTASTTRYWDCSGGACGCAYLPLGAGTDSNPAHCHSNAMFSAPAGNEYGAQFYGAAAISRFLWDGNTNSGDWLGEGCGKCYKVTGSSNTGPIPGVATTVVLKGTNICPTGICNENGKAHFDIAAPGFDVLEYSWSNTCEELEPEEIEGFNSCGRWMIDSQEWELNCDCSKFKSPVLRAGCENFYSLKWDNAPVTYEEVACPPEIASLPCWEENGNGYPQEGIPQTCMDPNGDPNVILPFPGSPPSVQPPTPTTPSPPTTAPPPSPSGPTVLEPIECPDGYQNARWTWYISYPKCCADQLHYDPLASTEECEVYNGCAWDGDFAYVGNRPYTYVENTDIVAFFASGGETFPKKIIRVYSPSHGKTVDAIVLDTCGDDDCNGCCTENADTGGGYLVDMEENTVVRHFGALEEAEGLVCWKILDDEEYDAGGYCNWGACNGEAQGGWDCNLNEYECKTTCGGGNWCDTTTGVVPTPGPEPLPVTPSPIRVTPNPVVSPTSPSPVESPITESPTEPPIPTPGGEPCCSWDLKECSLDAWCNASESNCKGSCGGPFWADLSSCPADGVGKSGDCINANCCPGLYCHEHSQWYKSCEVAAA